MINSKFDIAKIKRKRRLTQLVPFSLTSLEFQHIVLASMMCRKSVRMPASAFSSEMSALSDLRYILSSCACSCLKRKQIDKKDKAM